MKIRSALGTFAALAAVSLGGVAHAQPRPAPPIGVRPAPPTGVRPAPPGGVDNRQEHEIRHQETEAQIRDRLQKQEAAEQAQRKLAHKDQRAWDAGREQRAAQARSELTSTWGDISEQPEAKAELATHAERMAQLNRILDVAQDQGNTALVTHTNSVIQREIARDTKVLQGIRARGGAR